MKVKAGKTESDLSVQYVKAMKKIFPKLNYDNLLRRKASVNSQHSKGSKDSVDSCPYDTLAESSLAEGTKTSRSTGIDGWENTPSTQNENGQFG